MFITFTLYSLLHTFLLTVVASIIKLNTANKTLQKNHLNLKSPHTRKSCYLHITHKGTESIRIKCLKITVMAEVGKVGNFSSQSVVSWLPCPPTFCLTNLSAMRGREECSSFLIKKNKGGTSVFHYMSVLLSHLLLASFNKQQKTRPALWFRCNKISYHKSKGVTIPNNPGKLLPTVTAQAMA